MFASVVYQSTMSAAMAAPIKDSADWLRSDHGFATIRTSETGHMLIRNSAERLRAFGDVVRANWQAFGGGAKPAELAAPRRAIGARYSASSVQVWREQIESGNAHEAARLGLEKLGMRCYSHRGKAFAIVAPKPVDGLPPEIMSGRRDDGKWIVFDTVSGSAIGNRGQLTRASAEKHGSREWLALDATKIASSMAHARSGESAAAGKTQALALAEWCAKNGADMSDLPPALADVASPADDCQAVDTGADVAAPADCASEPASEPGPVTVIETQALEPHTFGARLLTTRAAIIASFTHVCAGPGLASADLADADAKLRALAAERGWVVECSGFGSGGARAWCTPDPAACHRRAALVDLSGPVYRAHCKTAEAARGMLASQPDDMAMAESLPELRHIAPWRTAESVRLRQALAAAVRASRSTPQPLPPCSGIRHRRSAGRCQPVPAEPGRAGTLARGWPGFWPGAPRRGRRRFFGATMCEFGG